MSERIQSACMILLALVFTVLSAGGARSQETRAAQVPADLVAALLGVPADQLTIGRIPDGLPFTVALPAGARVLGGLRRGANTVVALTLPLPRPRALAAVRESLLADGWTVAPQTERRGGGFVSGSGPVAGALCRGGGQATVTPGRGASTGESAIRLNITVGANLAPCAPQPGQRLRLTDLPMPTLTAPEGERMRSAGGSQSEDHAESRALFDGGMAVDELAEHFHVQLDELGWVMASRLSDEDIAVRTYTLDSADGGSWQGVLIVSARPDSPLRDLTFRLTDVRRPR